MASISFGLNLDPNDAFLNMPSNIDMVSITTDTIFEVGDPRFTLLRLEGTGFTYSSQGVPSGGTLTGFKLLQGGQTAVVVTGLSMALTLVEAETLRLGGVVNALIGYLLSSNDVAIGGFGGQVMLSQGGNDTLDGREGADYISAGDGDDLVTSQLGHGPSPGEYEDLIGGGGTDRLRIDRSDQVLSLIFDVVSYGTTTMADGTRLSAFEQMEFHAGAGNDELAGGSFGDIINGGAGDDKLTGREGNDLLRGDDGADIINGGTGNDLLTGNGGIDLLSGGEGEDILVGGEGVDNAAGGNGDDVLTGDEGADLLAGDAGNDFIDGGGQADNIFGGAGADLLSGGMGADYIEGGTGNDLLEGGPGPDVMVGGPGDDLYWVDNGDDLIFEGVKGGFETVILHASYALPSTAEIELMRTVRATSKSAINLTGNNYKNSIEGNAGSNTINGRSGSDRLKGGSGTDVFVFDTPIGKRNVDKIMDFRVSDDSILLSRSIFREISGRKTLDSSNFHLGSHALDAADRIIYNPRNGIIFYDKDGNGVHQAIIFAKVSKNLKLTHADFLI